jgi:hypothetical protein
MYLWVLDLEFDYEWAKPVAGSGYGGCDLLLGREELFAAAERLEDMATH